MRPENVQEEVAEPELRGTDRSHVTQAHVTQAGSNGASRDHYIPTKNAHTVSPSIAHDSIIAFKFGGSSLLGAERMRHAAGLVRPLAESSRVVVIVSAMKGVT